ncbi:MAG: DUF4292 domain-containing protein [Muribaculaceae bacterium]|nr:DUF4292 domain-containing protein [Muribaculaceae bacterium]
MKLLRNISNSVKANGLVVICVLLSMISICPAAFAANDANEQERLLSKRECKDLAGELNEGYKPWSRVAINGKLRTEMLPVSLTLRVAMERDKRLALSIRAPFLGEVMRVEMTPGELYIINRKKKTYHQMEYDADRPLLQYAQDLLLGRVVVVGSGVLSKSNVGKCKIYELSSTTAAGDTVCDGYGIIPEAFADGLSYGYTISPDYKMTGISVAVVEKLIEAIKGGTYSSETDIEEYVPVANVDVAYRNSGKAQASIYVNFDKYSISATLECDEPEYGAKLLEPFELTSAYRSVGLRDVIRF